jgi:hypothetical protein
VGRCSASSSGTSTTPTADAGKHIIVTHNIAMLLVHASYRRPAQKHAAGSDAALTQGEISLHSCCGCSDD